MHFGRHAESMFLLHCPACGQRELRSTRALSSFSSTPHGIELTMKCTGCGSLVHTVTGARAGRTETHSSTPPARAGAAA
jgi:uncharacterized Zn finger protein